MKVKLNGQDIREFPDNSTVRDIAFAISPKLGKAALCGVEDGEIINLMAVPKEGSDLRIATFDDEEGKYVFWHTTSHILAQAVKRLYPEAKLAIGPPVSNGFYYDIEFEQPLKEDELPAIEDEMRKIVKEKLELERMELPRPEALDFVKKQGEPYKVELIQDLPDDAVLSFYTQGEFTDLCRGRHVNNTGAIKAIKLMKVAGAYWRGDENKQMLTRIYGISFPKQKLLDEYLQKLEEAKKRDHRKLGRELKLFTFFEEGPGFPVYMNKGMIFKNILTDYLRRLMRRENYQEISTPMMLNRDLWETSGHWFHYKENMYTSTIDDKEFAIKPMNCPGGVTLYKQQMVSYKDFPLKLAEIGHVHRHELSGALNGLLRVRAFTQDDAHIFLLPEQITDEIKSLMRLVDEIYSRFGFEYKVELSTRPDDFMGEIKDWDFAEESLKKALEEMNVEYKLNEGDGAFYGPKIDFHLVDCLDREWQCGTIQLDFQLPQRFDIEYTAQDGTKKRPSMLHRAIYGSFERLTAILIEHYAGAFPLWLAPVQIGVLSISDDFNDYAEEVAAKLKYYNFRVETDTRNERIGYKIREATMQKYPYLIIVGAEEKNAGTISIRPRGEVKNQSMNVDEFIKKLKAELIEQGEPEIK